MTIKIMIYKKWVFQRIVKFINYPYQKTIIDDDYFEVYYKVKSLNDFKYLLNELTLLFDLDSNDYYIPTIFYNRDTDQIVIDFMTDG